MITLLASNSNAMTLSVGSPPPEEAKTLLAQERGKDRTKLHEASPSPNPFCQTPIGPAGDWVSLNLTSSALCEVEAVPLNVEQSSSLLRCNLEHQQFVQRILASSVVCAFDLARVLSKLVPFDFEQIMSRGSRLVVKTMYDLRSTVCQH